MARKYEGTKFKNTAIKQRKNAAKKDLLATDIGTCDFLQTTPPRLRSMLIHIKKAKIKNPKIGRLSVGTVLMFLHPKDKITRKPTAVTDAIALLAFDCICFVILYFFP